MWLAILGTLVGIAGGCFGMYASVKKTESPQERRFVIWCAVGVWVAVLAFLAVLLLTPQPYNWLAWIPYGILLPVAIIAINRKQIEIRQAAAADPG